MLPTLVATEMDDGMRRNGVADSAAGHDGQDPDGSNRDSPSRDMASLRADSLRSLAIAYATSAYLCTAYLVMVRHDTRPLPWAMAVSLLVISLVALWLLRRRAALACTLFAVLLTLLTAVFIALTPDARAPFTMVLPILTASVVVPRRVQAGIDAGGCAGLALLGWLHGPEAAPAFEAALLLSAGVALVAWLASRNLYLAVEWATYSNQQALRSLMELRERRAHLRQLADMLHHNQERMHYLNVRLEQAKVAAEEAYRTKQHFVANVSHELRTPLNLITGFSEMMCFSPESYGGVRLPPQYREDVMEIYRSSKHLLGLVEDVLALAQLEAGQMIVQREWTNVAEIVQDAAETIRPLTEGKGLTLSVAIPPDLPEAFIDAGRIRQVLLNLLNNASRFTERGEIAVSVACQGDNLTIAVRDTGVGIAEEDLPHIFEEFHNLSGGPSARRSGFGLGLSISRRLVEAHGGTLCATSRVGKGSCFTVTLPVANGGNGVRRPTLVHTGPRAEVDRAKPVVLVVGDGDAAPVLDRYLSRYHVLHARSAEAVSACEQYLPVAIWVNDCPALGELPAHVAALMRGWPQLPIVTCQLPRTDDMARRLGVDKFFGKPIVRERLAQAIEELAATAPIDSVLVVDDDPPMVRLLRRMLLSILGPTCRVVEACGGREGLDIIAQGPPDLVLLDLAMPEVSGYDVLNAIRATSSPHPVRVILMSGVELGDEGVPVNAITVQSQAGFSLQKALGVTAALVEQLSPRLG